MDTPPLAKVHSIEYLYPSIYYRAAHLCTQSLSSTLIPYSHSTIILLSEQTRRNLHQSTYAILIVESMSILGATLRHDTSPHYPNPRFGSTVQYQTSPTATLRYMSSRTPAQAQPIPAPATPTDRAAPPLLERDKGTQV
jgi:hypothetical protein